LVADPTMQERWINFTDQQRAVIMAALQQFKSLGGDSSMATLMMLAQMSSKPTVSFEREKETFYSQLDIENVKILKLKKSGEMMEIHIKIPTAIIPKLVIKKIKELIDANKLLINQLKKSTSPIEVDG